MSAPDDGRVTVFDLGDELVFKHYFGNEALFGALAEHYEDDAYRFSVPHGSFGAIREELEGHGYGVDVVTDPEPFCVAVERYEPHADLLRASVAHWTRRGHEFFLLPDEASVEDAVREGARRVDDTDLVAGI